jgi:hypothetical protein
MPRNGESGQTVGQIAAEFGTFAAIFPNPGPTPHPKTIFFLLFYSILFARTQVFASDRKRPRAFQEVATIDPDNVFIPNGTGRNRGQTETDPDGWNDQSNT